MSLTKPGARFSKFRRKLFGPENSEKLVFYYDLKMRKGKFGAKFHAWKHLRFYDTKEIMAPEIGLESSGAFKKRTPGTN